MRLFRLNGFSNAFQSVYISETKEKRKNKSSVADMFRHCGLNLLHDIDLTPIPVHISFVRCVQMSNINQIRRPEKVGHIIAASHTDIVYAKLSVDPSSLTFSNFSTNFIDSEGSS